jgi:hypothetical protein
VTTVTLRRARPDEASMLSDLALRWSRAGAGRAARGSSDGGRRTRCPGVALDPIVGLQIATRDLDAFIAAGRVDVGELPTLRRGA